MGEYLFRGEAIHGVEMPCSLISTTAVFSTFSAFAKLVGQLCGKRAARIFE